MKSITRRRFLRTARDIIGLGTMIATSLPYSFATANLENRLEFDFHNHGWSASEESLLEKVIPIIYDELVKVYGHPLFSSTVKIANEEPPYETANGQYVDFEKKIYVRGISLSTIIHEMAHAFRGRKIIFHRAFEEGGADAAADIVSYNLHSDPRLEELRHLLHWREATYYEGLNVPQIAVRNGYYPRNVDSIGGLAYSLGSAVFKKLYTLDNEFFIKFNRRYNKLADSQEWFSSDLERGYLLKREISKIIDIVEGMPIREWLNNQHILDSESYGDYKLFVSGTDFLEINYIDRYGMFVKNPVHNVRLFDNENMLIHETTTRDHGISLSSLLHEIYLRDIGYPNTDFRYDSDIPERVRYRAEITSSFEDGSNKVTQTYYIPWLHVYGKIFGLIDSVNSGIVRICHRDSNRQLSVDIVNGVFETETKDKNFGSDKGTYEVIIDAPQGRFKKVFVKDELTTSYYVPFLTRQFLLESISGMPESDGVIGCFPTPLTNQNDSVNIYYMHDNTNIRKLELRNGENRIAQVRIYTPSGKLVTEMTNPDTHYKVFNNGLDGQGCVLEWN